MQNLLEKLEKLLSKDERLTVDGKLLKNKVVELGLKLDKELIKLLLSDKSIKEVFFADIAGTLVFDKDKFIRFVSNKQFLPDSFTSFKQKIGLLDEHSRYFSEIPKNEVVLAWPYKDCVLQGGMTKEEQKRNEIFWNETLAPDEVSRLLEPKVFTNAKRIDKKGDHKLDKFKTDDKGNIKDNLIIKGNNLLVLHSLLKRFAGRVKLIYIDPPFNTGADSFGYNDSFNHSAWLTFMRNRLTIAKGLLRHDGYFCIQCSWHEHAYLTILADEIFERSNRLCTFNIQVRHPERILTGDKEYNDIIEYVLVYKKDARIRMPKMIESKDDSEYILEVTELSKGTKILLGKKEAFVFQPDEYKIEKKPASANLLKSISVRGSIREKNSSGRFYVKYLEDLKEEYPPRTLFKIPSIGDDSLAYRYFYLPSKGKKNGGYYQGKPTSSDVTEKPYPNFYDFSEEYNNVSDQGGVKFRNAKKPEELLAFLIGIFSEKGDIILDYHLGSGATSAVAHKLGRQFLGVEQLDYGEDDSVVRLKNVLMGDDTGISEELGWKGGGDFVYLELMKWNDNYVEIIQKTQNKKELQELWQTMKEKAFLSYKVDVKAIDGNAKQFEELALEDQKRFLMECLDKNHLYVNYSDIEDEEYRVSEEDKKKNRDFYGK